MPVKNEIVSSRDIFEIGDVVTRRGEKLVVTGRKRLSDGWAYTVLPQDVYLARLAAAWGDEDAKVELPVTRPSWWRRLKSWWRSLHWA